MGVAAGAGEFGEEVESDLVGLGEGDLVQVGGEDSVGEDGANGAEADAEDPDAEARRDGTERGGGGGRDFAIYFGVASRGIIPDLALRRAIFSGGSGSGEGAGGFGRGGVFAGDEEGDDAEEGGDNHRQAGNHGDVEGVDLVEDLQPSAFVLLGPPSDVVLGGESAAGGGRGGLGLGDAGEGLGRFGRRGGRGGLGLLFRQGRGGDLLRRGGRGGLGLGDAGGGGFGLRFGEGGRGRGEQERASGQGEGGGQFLADFHVRVVLSRTDHITFAPRGASWRRVGGIRGRGRGRFCGGRIRR